MIWTGGGHAEVNGIAKRDIALIGYRLSISFSGLCSTVIVANRSAEIEGENRDEMVI